VRIVFTAVTALVVTVALVGCGDSDPQYEGVVESAGRTSIEIRHDADACGRSAFEPVEGVTVRRGGDEIAWADVRAGDRVRVWTNGYQDDSCPTQAGAERIEVTER